ncbi:hypothetical protein BD410DRAFT_607610 [Rickenella mellea]|uniref:Uncharacterized protein n=1 Tax=Rickenella mellea TaxID=50990 RepID=A0A4Y7QFY8_9AGAM|nr:hypothetical protein BD410DRAFT_607610 [Rickenella mellea]
MHAGAVQHPIAPLPRDIPLPTTDTLGSPQLARRSQQPEATSHNLATSPLSPPAADDRLQLQGQSTLEANHTSRPVHSTRRTSPFLASPVEIDVPKANSHRRKRTMSSGEGASSPPLVDFVRGRQAHSEGGDSFSGRARGRSVPRRIFHASSSSESDRPSPGVFPMPPIPNYSSRQLLRETMLKRESGTSSSLYPPSVSSVSGTESLPSLPSLPSPRSLASVERYDSVRSVDPDDDEDDINPHMQELHDLDADDVSYRLRLLVKNNYYLPPAHAKPYPPNLMPSAPASKKPSPKSSSPTFLDIFKVGKSRSKATTPEKPTFPPGVQVLQGLLPALRTTSDATTLSATYPHPHASRSPHSQPHSPLTAHPHAHQDRKGRVVVVRERMEDLASAAKQAELDLRQREAERRKAGGTDTSDSEKDDDFDDFIDPTDAVDLPPLTGGYRIAPQASALNGMGVEASVGAAMLADRLPPGTPGVWSVDSSEAAWRRALLHEAVGHSLNNSMSTTSPSAGTPVPSLHLNTAVPRPAVSPSSTLRKKRELGQRILTQIMDDEDFEVSPDRVEVDGPVPPAMLNTTNLVDTSRLSSGSMNPPLRAETPTVPTHPLAPPPRTTPLTPLHSIFHGDNPIQGSRPRLIRKAISSPLLPNHYETLAGITRATSTTPTQRFSPAVILHDPEGVESVQSLAGTRRSMSTGSMYSDIDEDEDEDEDEDDTAFHTPNEMISSDLDMDIDVSFDAQPRPSLTASLLSQGRASSEYSQPSPTVSAFRDALEGNRYSRAPSSTTHSHGQHSARTSRHLSGLSRGYDSPNPSRRSDILTPPPRTSASYVSTVLSPPPRSGNVFVRPVVMRSPSPGRPSDDSMWSHGGRAEDGEMLVDPDLSAERSLSPPMEEEVEGPELELPVHPFAAAERQLPVVAPPIPPHPAAAVPAAASGNNSNNRIQPPTPISFFDEVEAQNVGMDDSSEEDSDDDGEDGESEMETAILFVDPNTMAVSNTPMRRAEPAILKLDNNSNPYLVASSSSDGHGRGVHGHPGRPPLPISLPSPMFARGDPQGGSSSAAGASGSGPSGSASGSTPEKPKVLKKERKKRAAQKGASLDGLLIQHMENERDTIRRITHTLTQT